MKTYRVRFAKSSCSSGSCGAPDCNKSGPYSVTFDARRVAASAADVLAGPFEDDHAKALAMVSEAARKAVDMNSLYHWHAFGTMRSSEDLGPGKLNQELGR